jgi:hypothetical protein
VSLIRLAVRVAAVQSLIGRTIAGERVYDSAMAPLDDLVKEDPAPFIIVTTDDDEVDLTGRDLFDGHRSLDLVIEFAIAGRAQSGETTIPQTDEGLEVTIDVLQRQIARALIDEATVWSGDFKRLCPRFHSVRTRRGASTESGIRFAARQMILTVDTLNDPPIGVALDPAHPIALLADHLEAADMPTIAALIRAEAAGDLIPDWDRVRVDLGMTKAAADAVGVGDYPVGEDAVEMTDIIVDRPIGDDVTVTEETVEDQFPNDA